MYYLIKSFLNQLESYGIKYEIKRPRKNFYTIDLFNLSTKLQEDLLHLSYDEVLKVSYNGDRTTGKTTQNYETKTIQCCNIAVNGNSCVIRTELDSKTYAKKLTEIDKVIRRYQRNGNGLH